MKSHTHTGWCPTLQCIAEYVPSKERVACLSPVSDFVRSIFSSHGGGNVGGDCPFEYGRGLRAQVEPTGSVPVTV